MSKYRYIVFGAGRQGTAAIHDLVLNCEAKSVHVVEPDAARLAAAKERLSKLLKRRASVLSYAASAGPADLRGLHGALSCATHHANPELTAMAIEAGVPFTDLGGNDVVVAKQERMAAKSKVPVVPDCGVSPGISNIVAVHCVKAHGCDEVRVRCGGLPLERPDPKRNPLQYKLAFSPWGLLSEYSGDVARIRDGKVGTWPALSVTEEFDDEHESAPTSNNSPQVVEYLAECGVETYDYMTIRYKGHWDLVRGWKTLGLLARDPDRDAHLVKLLESDPVLQYHPAKDRDKLILRVRGAKTENGFTRGVEYRFDVAADKKTKFSAMELTTGWGITIVAHHIASGRGAPKGFATPERFVDSGWVISELERRLAQIG
jgi:saccharopine dehydrogenase-like NADP-dependent oxidoreductase